MNNFIEHQLNLSVSEKIRVLVEDTSDRPACVLVFGTCVGDGCLVRVHSRCLYGDVFLSHDCDCGEQLAASRHLIQQEGSGVIIYLDQEGRGCGLANKAHGYVLTQTKQMDTFAAYDALGLSEDARDYSVVVQILQILGLRSVRLLTNNPNKVVAIESAGIYVERVALVISPTLHTRDYLAAKKRIGHLL